MEYREVLTDLILNKDNDTYINWLQQQPLILQPAIAQEFIELAQELAAERGIVLDPEDIKGYTQQVKKYEQAILDEQVAGVNVHLAQLAVEDSNKQIEETIQGVKDYVKECVVNNADNAKEMTQLAQQIKQIEIDNDTYDELEWLWLNDYI